MIMIMMETRYSALFCPGMDPRGTLQGSDLKQGYEQHGLRVYMALINKTKKTDKNLIHDSLIDGKPMELSEYGSNVIKLLGTHGDPGSSF